MLAEHGGTCCDYLGHGFEAGEGQGGEKRTSLQG